MLQKELTNEIILHQLDLKKNPFSIFIDLSKAFDAIDHTILLRIFILLEYYGIQKIIL